jgi:nucleotide-binding universal stress UspA family protein
VFIGRVGASYDISNKAQTNQAACGQNANFALRNILSSVMVTTRRYTIPATTESLRYVVAVDGSRNSDHAFAEAVKCKREQDSLVVLHVVTPAANTGEGLDPASIQTKYEQLILENKQATNTTVQLLNVQDLDVAKHIVSTAEDTYDFLVMGTDGMKGFIEASETASLLASLTDSVCSQCRNINILVTQVSTTPDA